MDELIRAFDAASSKAAHIASLAHRGGITVAFDVTLTGPEGNPPLLRAEQDADEPFTAASLNKLAIALWALEVYADRYTDTVTWTDTDRRAGGGRFDEPDAPLSATLGELLADMLARSGNTAMAVLGWMNFYIVNGVLKRDGYTVTRLHEAGDIGRFETGVTTANEALCLLEAIVESPRSGPLGHLVGDALMRSVSKVRAGTHRQWSKHGELNGPDNGGEYVRHEVGIIENEGSTLGYAVLTRFTGDATIIGAMKAKFAGKIVGDIGSAFAQVIGRDAAPVHRPTAALII